jgi:3-hydroxyisobutyrate dehydrogenase
VEVVVDTLNGADQPGTFDIEGLLKDLNLALEQAQVEGVNLPLATAAMPRYRAAIQDGLGRYDGASLTRLASKG